MKVKFLEKHFDKCLDLGIDTFSEVSTDTRTLKEGSLFIAIKGENFDGNKFVQEALKKGAVAAITSDKSLESERVIYVPNTLKAFQGLSQAWQNYVQPQVIGITGSNGKTTTKFFTAQLLKNFFKIRFSPKSFNNEIGVPITQSQLREGDQVLISEIGTNHPGEIKNLIQMIHPQICLVTTVGPSHLEGFGTVENVAKEKNEIYKPKSIEVGIFNLDNKWTKKMYEQHPGRKITFSSQNQDADIYLKAEQKSLSVLHIKGKCFEEKIEKELKLFGEHNIYNIMGALACGKALEVSTKKLIEALENLQTPWGRSEVYKNSFGGEVLFDGYNSNLQSMVALFESLKKIKNKKINLILGEMLELGGQTAELHKELGQRAAELNLNALVFIGSSHKHFSSSIKKAEIVKNSIFSDSYNEELAIKVQNMIDLKGLTVIKGSRGTKLERFFKVLGLDL